MILLQPRSLNRTQSWRHLPYSEKALSRANHQFATAAHSGKGVERSQGAARIWIWCGCLSRREMRHKSTTRGQMILTRGEPQC